MAKRNRKKVLLIDLDPQSSQSDVFMTKFRGQLDDLENE